VTDADLSDTVTPTVASVTVSGVTGGLTSAGVLGVLTGSPASIAANPGDTHNPSWSVHSTPPAFNFLPGNQPLPPPHHRKVDDGHPGGTATQPVTIIITGTDDAPVISVAATASSYTQGGPAVTLLSAATVSDVDNQTMQSATVTITDFVAGDVLAFTNNNSTTYGNIAASYNAGVLILTSAGATATLAQWQAAPDAGQYSPATPQPH